MNFIYKTVFIVKSQSATQDYTGDTLISCNLNLIEVIYTLLLLLTV